MRWLSRKDRRVKQVLEQKKWHQWYAWYPVRLSSDGDRFDETVWLEPIYRRLDWPYPSWYGKNEEYNAALTIAKMWLWKRVYIYKDLTDLIVDDAEEQSKKSNLSGTR